MKLKNTLVLFVVAGIFQSCIGFNEIIVENDYARSVKRMKANFSNGFAQERLSPLLNRRQTIVKEVFADSTERYLSYDFLSLRTNSFCLSNTVYLIADGVPFEMDVTDLESQFARNIEEKRNDILTADSSKLSVVTGYKENVSLDYKIMYLLAPNTIEHIKSAKSVQFRYYAGHDMITVQLTEFQLQRFQKLIAMR